MSKSRVPQQARVKIPGRGRELCELRRSHAAGHHGKTHKDRANTERRAIAADYRAG